MNSRFCFMKEGNKIKVFVITDSGQEALQTDMLKEDNLTINVGTEHGAVLPNNGYPGISLICLPGILFTSPAGQD